MDFLEMRDTAESLINEGYKVLPLRGDKSPFNCKNFIYEQPDLDDRFNECAGIGVVCGNTSNNLLVIDFDKHNNEDINQIWGDFISDSVVSHIIESNNLPIIQTRSGGYHIYLRTEKGLPTQKLSLWADGGVMIETRGNGSYVVTPPTPGWEQISGGDILELNIIDDDAVDYLLTFSRTFTQAQLSEDKKQESKGTWPSKFNTSSAVGMYNEHGVSDLFSLLQEAGWMNAGTRRDGTVLWTRPGKQRGVSATFGKYHNMFFCFSGSQQTFITNKAYSPFYAMCALKFDNNVALARQYANDLFNIHTVDIDIDKELTQQAEFKPMPFPIHAFPENLQTLLLELRDTENLNIDLLSIALMYSVATIAGNKVKLRVKTTWVAPLIFWFAAVGKTGTKKSHPISTMLAPLNDINKENFALYKEERQKWEANEKKGAEPQPRQLYLDDYTLEALLSRHAVNPRGISIYKDELNGFFNDMNKYRKGSDEEFWLQSYNNKSYQVARKTTEPLRVDNLCISIIGTIQPEVMAGVADASKGNGVIERFLFSNNLTEYDYFDTNCISHKFIEFYYEFINQLNWLCRYEEKADEIMLTIPDSSMSYFKQIQDRLTDIKKSDKTTSYIAGYCSKLQTYAPRFILLCCVMRVASEYKYDEFTGIEDFKRNLFVIDQDVKNAAWLVAYFLSTANSIQEQSIESKEVKEVSGALKGMTSKEKVIELSRKGITSKAISEQLKISIRTVQRYLQSAGEGKK